MNLFTRRIRGFRLVDLVGFGLLVVIILGVYLAKTVAGRERAEIASVEKKIDGETARIRLLQAEVAHLEQPGRIERLSVTYLGLKPVSVKNEASVDQLIEIAHTPPAKAAAPSAVAALVTGADIVPGVPPPPPPEAQPVRMAAAQPGTQAQ